MEIVKQQRGEAVELKIQGRIDAYWSDHLTRSIEESVVGGARRIHLNLSRVDYLSSAGIRVLIMVNKHLRAMAGGLHVTHPSDSVLSVITLSGLDGMLLSDERATEEVETKSEHRRWETDTAVFHADDLVPGAKLKCQLVGDPRKLVEGGYEEGDAHTLNFPEATFGLGLGALGSSFAECRERVGEFIALAGTAAYLPTDGSNRPDSMVSEDAFVPQMNVLYGISGQGQFATQVRFEAKNVVPGVVTLPEIVAQLLQTTEADMVGLAMLAESSTLVGAALKKSESPTHPGETLLSFPTEQTFERTRCLIVGVAARRPLPGWRSVLDPLTGDAETVGHFHVTTFPNEPLPAGVVKMQPTVRQLFNEVSARKLLHLLHTDGTVQTEFVRGLCWFGPVDLPPTPARVAGAFNLRVR